MEFRTEFVCHDFESICYMYLDKRFLQIGKYTLESYLLQVDHAILDKMQCVDSQAYIRVLYNLLHFHTRSFPQFPEGFEEGASKKIKKEDIVYRRFTADNKPMVEIAIRPYRAPFPRELSDDPTVNSVPTPTVNPVPSPGDDLFAPEPVSSNGQTPSTTGEEQAQAAEAETTESVTIVGWMFIFKCLDRTLDIDAEMARFFKEFNAKCLKREKLKQASMEELTNNPFTVCFEKEIWFTIFLPSVCPELYKNNAAQKLANSKELRGGHQFALSKIFSLENAVKRLGNAIPLDEYYILGEEFFVNINSFLKYNLNDLKRNSAGVEDTTIARENNFSMSNSGRGLSPSAENLFDSTREAVADMKKACGKKDDCYSEKWDKFTKSDDCRDMIMSYVLSDDFNPGRKIATKFLLDEISVAKQKSQAFKLHPTTRPNGIDFRKTIFGNLISIFYYKINQLLRNHFHHEEQVLLLISSLLMYTFGNDELRLHIIISGPSEAGKSFLIQMLILLTIFGICKEYAQGSEKAHTTDSNWNMFFIVADEGPKDILQRDADNGSTGSSTVKTMMTSGHLLVHRAYVDEKTKKIVTNETACERRCLFFIVMNPAFKMMPTSIQSRVYKHHLPLLSIRNDAVLENRKINKAHFDQFRKTHQYRQALAAYLCAMIDMDLIENINMEIPVIMANIVNNVLDRKYNIVLDGRDWQRIFTFCKALVIFYALEMVFFSRVSDREFDILQLFECQQYLFCTREIFWYALGHFQNSILSPYLHIVLDGFRLASNGGQTDNPPVFERYFDEGSKGMVDSQVYYFLEVTIVDRKQPISNYIASIIADAISNSLYVTLSAEMIEDILQPYNEKGMNSHGANIFKIQYVTRMHKSGLRVSKQFYDLIMSNPGTHIVEDLIRASMDEFTSEYDYIYGTTDRLKGMSPFVPCTVRSKPKVLAQHGGNKRRLRVANVDYQPPEYDYFMDNEKIVNPKKLRPKRFSRLTTNLDKKIQKKIVNAVYGIPSQHPYTCDPKAIFDFPDYKQPEDQEESSEEEEEEEPYETPSESEALETHPEAIPDGSTEEQMNVEALSNPSTSDIIAKTNNSQTRHPGTSFHFIPPPTSRTLDLADPETLVAPPPPPTTTTPSVVRPLSFHELKRVKAPSASTIFEPPVKPDAATLKLNKAKNIEKKRKKDKETKKKQREKAEADAKIRKKHKPISIVFEEASHSGVSEAEESGTADSFIVSSDEELFAEEDDGISLGSRDTQPEKRRRIIQSDSDSIQGSIVEEEHQEAVESQESNGEEAGNVTREEPEEEEALL